MAAGGITSTRALILLRDCLASELVVTGSGSRGLWCSRLLKLRALKHSYEDCNISCYTYSTCTLFVVVFLTVYGCGYAADGAAAFDHLLAAFWLFIFLAIDLALALYVLYMCSTELMRKSVQLISMIDRIVNEKPDTLETPPLHCPWSESVELCWTYRDGHLVNLPSVLLVPGDSILLRPGRPTVCRCQHLITGRKYDKGEVFVCDVQAVRGSLLLVEPSQAQLATVLEAPASLVMRKFHMYGAHTISPLEREYDYLIHGCFEKVLLPSAAVFALLAGIPHYLSYGPQFGPEVVMSFMADFLLTVTPLLFPALPLYFTAFKFFNSARLLDQRGLRRRRRDRSSSSGLYGTFCFFNKTNGASGPLTLLKRAVRLFNGSGQNLPFTSSLYPILGSITSVTVINKRGILSWPDPSVEKVFFFVKGDGEQQPKQQSRQRSCRSDSFPILSSLSRKAYVMDVSQDGSEPCRINFDDASWPSFLGHLKPLALNAELNNCQPEEEYCKFVDHLHSVAVSVSATTAVANRRCFCALATALQLQKVAGRQFHQPGRVICAYRKRGTDAAVGCPLAAGGGPPLPQRHKVPLSNVFCTVHKEKTSSYAQMMCQGTADMVLDMCSYYWDGRRIRPLEQSHAKRILEFSNRHNMTAYCLALSYRPLPCWLAEDSSTGYYDLPANFFNKQQSGGNGDAALYGNGNTHSLDSLLDDKMLLLGTPCKEKEADLLFRNHVFLGMLSFQYLAKPEIVNLVEQLDKCCIRFVHFSKENELRSRVFAEKMGLEAGWNCHISLQSEGVSVSSSRKAFGASSFEDTFSNGLAVMARNVSMPNVSIRQPSPLVNGVAEALYGRRWPHFSLPVSPGAQSLLPAAVPEQECDRLAAATPLLNDQSPISCVSDASSSDRHNLTAMRNLARGDSFLLLTNRARLPKGIENVRPHLENVDNVPLLVSLFTDCDAGATCEMVEIMQENGEVVCVLGSSLNPENCGIFCRANIAISLEPMAPSGCCYHAAQKRNDDEKQVDSAAADAALVGRHRAVDIAHCINSLPCSLSVGRNERLSLDSSVKLSRHMLLMFRVSLFLYLALSFSLVIIQLLAMLCVMPRPFSSTMLMWFLCGFVPCLCASVALSPLKPGMPPLVTFKDRRSFTKREIQLYFIFFIVKFAPSAAMVFLLFRSFIYYLCERPLAAECSWKSSNSSSSLVLSHWQLSSSDQVRLAQRLSSLFTALYFVVISASCVFCHQQMWNRLPFSNTVWTVVTTILLLLHMAVCVLPLWLSQQSTVLISQIPWYVFFVGCLWPAIAVAILEVVKQFEIVRFSRDQRRRRLSFDTKLGMNSPF